MRTDEMWINETVRAGRHAYFAFRIPKEKKGFRVTFDGRIEDSGKDLIFMLMTFDDYGKWSNWKANPRIARRGPDDKVIRDKNGYPVYDPIPEPLTSKYINDRTSRLKETVNLDSETYALIFDNTYSTITDKTLQLSIIEEWNVEEPVTNLPVIDQLRDEVPNDVLVCLLKANECYASGHHEQASVMFRKAVDFAIRIKLLQSGLAESELVDQEGNDLSLSHKVTLLRKNNLITQRTSKDLDSIKWFGDMGAHSKMQIAPSDVRDVIEPKIRNFLTGLNLKA